MTDAQQHLDDIGRELGAHYQVVRQLGSGAFGAVYLARETRLHRLVAIKVLHAEKAWSDEERERLLREARTLANLSHPAIVPLLAFGETPSAVYMVMPYVEGETLAQRIEEEGRLEPREVRRILIEIADALGYAHGAGVLHRDLKPENVLLERAGALTDDVPPRVRLIDFGVAVFPTRDAGMNAKRETWGTPQFMAPEQLFGEPELDPRSELYSLGVLGYLLLGGELPFAAASVTERIRQQQQGPATSLSVMAPTAPRDLVEAIERCLAFEPEKRWARARDLRDALIRGADATSDVFVPLAVVRQRLRGRRRPTRARPARRAGARELVSGLGDDVRLSLRTLRKAPAFTVAVILTLAIGLTATTVVFSAVHALVLRPLPLPDPASLVVVQEERRGANASTSMGASTFRYDRYLAYREAAAGALSGLAAQAHESFSLRLGDRARPISGLVTSGNYWEVLGVRPALGRFYTGDLDRPGGAAPVAVVGHAFWRKTLGGDSAIVGRTLYLDSRPLTVVAVAPEGFQGAFAGVFAAEIWVPEATYHAARPGGGAPSAHTWVNVFGRLRAGVDRARATVLLDVSGRTVTPEDPRTTIARVWLDPVASVPVEMQRPAERFLAMLFGVAALVLLIAGTNAAGMLLARAAARARDIATRLAVGASRLRLVRQLLVESMLLCAAAGGAGLVVTWWVMRLLDAWQPPFPATVQAGFGVNGSVLGVALAMVFATGLLAGVTPAVQATDLDLAAAMKEGGVQSGARRTRLRSAFVVVQVALSVTLLVVAGLFTRSLQRTLAVDPGFDATGVVRAAVNLEPHGYDHARARVLYAQLLERLRARPEVEEASIARAAPLSGEVQTWRAGLPGGAADDRVPAQWGRGDVGMLEALRVPLLAGRTFTSADGPDAPRVTVINEALARSLWPREDARDVIGRELESLDQRMTVIGVVANGKYSMLQEETRGYGWVPFAQRFGLSSVLFVRARSDADAAARAAREELARLDANVALEGMRRLSDDIERYLIPQRVAAALVGVFGVAGIVLAMTGLYGVLAYTVTQRLREFGVRMALGAKPADLVRLVVRHGLRLTVVGLVAGLVVALVAGRLVSRFLFGLSPTDPVTLVGVPLLLLAVALVAGYLPARRAAAADPMASLRAE